MIKESKTPNSDKKDVKQTKNKLSINSLTHLLKELPLFMNVDNQNTEKNPDSTPDFKISRDQKAEHPTNAQMDSSATKNIEKDKNSNISREESEISFLENYQDLDSFKSLKKNKNKIKKILAVSFSLLLIIMGIILISTSVARVSDNVIFGERAMFSAFLILIGFLILAVVFAGKLLQGTFLKKIQNELEVTEGKARKTNDDPVNGKDKAINKKD